MVRVDPCTADLFFFVCPDRLGKCSRYDRVRKSSRRVRPGCKLLRRPRSRCLSFEERVSRSGLTVGSPPCFPMRDFALCKLRFFQRFPGIAHFLFLGMLHRPTRSGWLRPRLDCLFVSLFVNFCCSFGCWSVRFLFSDSESLQVLGGDKAQEVAQKLIDHHSKITNIFKEMYGDVRSVLNSPQICIHLMFSVLASIRRRFAAAEVREYGSRCCALVAYMDSARCVLYLARPLPYHNLRLFPRGSVNAREAWICGSVDLWHPSSHQKIRCHTVLYCCMCCCPADMVEIPRLFHVRTNYEPISIPLNVWFCFHKFIWWYSLHEREAWWCCSSGYLVAASHMFPLPCYIESSWCTLERHHSVYRSKGFDISSKASAIQTGEVKGGTCRPQQQNRLV